MWRALVVLVGGLLVVGIYSAATGGASTRAPTPSGAPSSGAFGFALAAGSIALAAAVLASRPRMRMRR